MKNKWEYELRILKNIARITQEKNPTKHDAIDDDNYHTTRDLSYYNRLYAPSEKSLESFLKKYASKLNEPLRILDIGCGNGNCVKDLLSLGYEAFGLDIKHYKNLIKDYFIVGDAEKTDNLLTHDKEVIKIPDEMFHVIISLHAIYHMKNPKAAIIQAYRMLKKGGTALLDCCCLSKKEEKYLQQSINAKINSLFVLLEK